MSPLSPDPPTVSTEPKAPRTETAAPALLKNVTGAMFWNTAFLPIKTVVSFIANLVLVRALTETEFSAFVAVTALLATLGLYADLGIERSLIRFVPEVEKSYGARGLVRFFVSLMLIKLAILIPMIAVLAGLAFFSNDYFHWGTQTGSIVALTSLLLVLGAFSDVLYQFLLAYFRQAGRNTLDVVTTLVQSLLTIVLVELGLGIIGALLALSCATILNVILAGRMVRQTIAKLHGEPTFHTPWRDIYGRLAKFSAMSFVLNLTTYLYDLPFVILALSYFGDTLGIGLFGLAFSRVVMPILRVLTAPLLGIQLPLLARLQHENDSTQLNAAYAALTRFLTLVLVPSAVGLALVAQPLIVLFFQARYAPATGAVAVLAIFLFAESLLSPGEIVLKVHDRYRIVLLTRLPALLSIPLLFILIPAAGEVGAAVAIGSARLLAQLVMTGVALKTLHLTFPFRFLVRVGLATLAMAIAVGLVATFGHAASPLDNLISLFLRLGAGLVTFLVCFKLLGGLEAADKQRLVQLRLPFKQTLVNWL